METINKSNQAYKGIMSDEEIQPIYLSEQQTYIMGRRSGKQFIILQIAKGGMIRNAYRQELNNVMTQK